LSLTTGYENTATGRAALGNKTTGNSNTATGHDALFSNLTGAANTADGDFALFSNTTGTDNTAVGWNALASGTSVQNTAVGSQALFSNTNGYNNTANGFGALNNNTTGYQNTAIGAGALGRNTTGSNNTATGLDALVNNTTGGNNAALGLNAGQNLTTGSNNIDIGNPGVAAEANTIRIGTMGTQTATYVAGIMRKTGPKGTPVFINANGLLSTVTSSARFKDEIKPMDKASEAILALKPVTFRYKKEFDPEGIPQFGLVAEEVEKINPDLIVRDADGKTYTVRYEAVNAMLLNEFLKQHRKVQEQEAAIAQQRKDFQAINALQEKEIQVLAVGLKEQASQIQKVSAQLELSKPVPRTVVNNQ
jgi:hypothetical protein